MRTPSLTYEDVLRIVELVKSTPFAEFRLKVGEIEVHLRRKNGAADAGEPAPAATDAPTAGAAPAPRGAKQIFPQGSVVVRAPMVGTFYRAPAPDAAPFVDIGQRVEPETTVCIIEVMKLMNSITADARGVVTAIHVADGEYVEYGEVLIVIRPDPEDG